MLGAAGGRAPGPAAAAAGQEDGAHSGGASLTRRMGKGECNLLSVSQLSEMLFEMTGPVLKMHFWAGATQMPLSIDSFDIII